MSGRSAWFRAWAITRLVVSGFVLALSIVLYSQGGGPLLTTRSTLVAIARADGVYVYCAAAGLVLFSLVLLRRSGVVLAEVGWYASLLVWCALGRSLTAYADIGTVKAHWYFIETKTVFCAEEKTLPAAERDPYGGVDSVTRKTRVAHDAGRIIFLFEGTSSSVFVGPFVMGKALDLLAYSNFNVDGYQDPACAPQPGRPCPGKPIPSSVPHIM